MQDSTIGKGKWNAGRPNANRGKKLPPETLTAAEVNALLAECGSTSATGLRNRALIVMLWRAGLRVSETLAMEPRDINRHGGAVRVRHGKGNKARVVGIDEQALAVLDRWMDRRGELGINGRQPVFCTLDGSDLAASYVRNLLKRLAKAAGIEKRVHPHGLRHTCASELRAEGSDVGVISKQLGHANISTTARYLDHIAPKAVIDTMRSRTW